MTDLRTLAEPFQFNGHDVRVAVDPDCHVFVCYQDMVAALHAGHLSEKDLREFLPDNWLLSLNGVPDLIFVNEPGAYALMNGWMGSVEMSNWLYAHVIPELRLQGLLTQDQSKARHELQEWVMALKAAAKGISAAVDDEMISGDEVFSLLNNIARQMQSCIGSGYP